MSRKPQRQVCQVEAEMSFLFSMQMIASNLSSDGRFVIARSFKPEDILRWDIVHADPYMDYKASDYSEDFQEEGIINEPVHEISNNMVCATNKASDQPAHMRSLIWAFASRLNIL